MIHFIRTLNHISNGLHLHVDCGREWDDADFLAGSFQEEQNAALHRHCRHVWKYFSDKSYLRISCFPK